MQSSLPIYPFEREVGAPVGVERHGAGVVLGGGAVVGGEDDDSVVQHVTRLQGRHHTPHRFVQLRHHRCNKQNTVTSSFWNSKVPIERMSKEWVKLHERLVELVGEYSLAVAYMYYRYSGLNLPLVFNMSQQGNLKTLGPSVEIYFFS